MPRGFNLLILDENEKLKWIQIVRELAPIYSLDPHILQAIITQESNWNIYAIRFEATYPYLYEPEVFSKKMKVSLSTEINSQKMSWGLGQVMGAVAREHGYSHPLPSLIDPQMNVIQMCLILQNIKKHSTLLSDLFACYNGGLKALHKVNGKYLNQGYVDSCVSHLKDLTEPKTEIHYE